MNKDNQKNSSLQIFNNFVIFQTENGKVNIDVFFKDDTLWLTQKKMGELFEVNVPAISKHLDNIYGDGELNKEATVSILETVQDEGGRKVNRKVESEYDKFRVIQDKNYISDFDREVKKLLDTAKNKK